MIRRSAGLALVLVVVASGQPPAHAGRSSLPSASTGRLPGPAVLYAPTPKAPQLENRWDRFRAAPLLVAGTDAYRDREYLYQDYIYDDWGADTGYTDSATTDSAGDLEYPLNRRRFGGNAADLVEFRVSVGEHDVAYRITLNTLLARDSTIAAIAFDTDRKPETGTSLLPNDPGAAFPGTDEVITTWGTGALHARSTKSGWKLRTIKSSVNLKSNQITVVVPRSVSDPRAIWRTTVATGLYDTKARSWLKPQMGDPTEDAPGGAMPDGSTPSIFNLAFRLDEHPAGITSTDTEQAAALRAGQPTRFARDIDFRALGGLVAMQKRSTVPRTGTMVRIFPSRLAKEGGKDFTQTPETRGQLQQYSLYVPKSYRPSRPAGLTLMLHSLGEHNWQYNGSIGVQQVGEQRGNLVLTPEARGEDGWYQAEAEYDVFEAWNDVARHYALDPNRAAVSGYSMGGYGTYRFGSLWPDLFGKAFSTVGPPADGIWLPPLPASGGEETNTNVWLENTRNVPFLNVVGMLDELVPYPGTRAQNLGAPEQGIRGFEQLGYRYRFVTYPAGDHFMIAVLSYDTPYATDFLGTAQVNRNPSHVTFSYVPATDHRKLGLVHNHAYWVSDIRVARFDEEIPKATVDAISHAAGRGDPQPVEVSNPGVGPIPYFEVGHDWSSAPRVPRQNKITLRLTNVRSVRIDAVRAGIDPRKPITLDISTTDDATIELPGRIVRVGRGHRVLRLR